MKLSAVVVFLMLAAAAFAYPVKVHQAALPLALQVLRQDGKSEVAAAFEPYLAKMLQGLSDADFRPTQLRFKVATISTRHGHHAFKHVGFAKDPLSAAVVAEVFFDSAKDKWSTDRGEACYDLSVAIHLLQDSFVPYHSTVSSNLVGHKAYEDYQREILDQAPSAGGIYSFSTLTTSDGRLLMDASKAFGWVDYGAHQSFDFYSLVSSAKDKSHYRQVSILLFKEMVRTVAGFLAFAYSQMEGGIADNGLIDGYLVGVYCDDNNQRCLGIFDGKNLTQLVPYDKSCFYFDVAVSPKLDAVAYVCQRASSDLEVKIVSLPSKRVRLLCSLPATNWSSLAWGTNDKLLVTAGGIGTCNHQLWIIDASSGEASCLNSQFSSSSFCYAWNADCTQIVCAAATFKFGSQDKCNRRLGLFDLEGQPRRNLSDPLVHPGCFMEGDPMSLPDGRIIYVVQLDMIDGWDLGHCQLWQVREDGSERKKLLEFVGNVDVHSRPCYGNGRLYFRVHDMINGKYVPLIYSIKTDGQDLRKFYPSATFVTPPGFLPRSTSF